MRDELTPREVAEELGVTIRTVQRWIATGRLPGSRVGGRFRVPREAMAAVGGSEADASPSEGSRTASALSALRPIRAILIANRGEIAVRISRTANRLGIRIIRVHEPDEPAPGGTALAIQVPSYLDADALLDAARRSGADAIHPGYGFLAENAPFAEAVERAGLTWIGPPPAAIRAMGDKAAARRLAAGQGVAVIRGYDGADQDDAVLVEAAREIGWPLLVKPAGGGGGKGMRVVREPGGLIEALAASRREAQAAFDDDRLILERLLEAPRHVEVQVLFDRYGKGVHIGERDCSAQRRQQKVLEEAPAPAIDARLRQSIGAAALTVAGAAGYVGAGTVEFLVSDGEFVFLEMNTRLQVEHPVSEAVTGRDLVADQLRIAAGDRLGLDQGDIRISGHAIEARIYAEDPESGFLPATGRLVDIKWPARDGVRVDAGVEMGDLVSDRYDPLLAKVIVHGPTRAVAAERLRDALADTRILGVRTNLRFLRWLANSEPFADAELRTDTLSAMALPGPIAVPMEAWASAASALIVDDDGPWAGGWRLNAGPSVRLALGDEERTVSPQPALPMARHGEHVFVDVEGQSVEFRLAPPPAIEDALRHASQAAGTAVLVAPMPGRVLVVHHRPGDVVAAHAPVVVLEAMKMEHAISAPLAGTVSAVHVAAGDQVQRGDVLAEVSA